MSGRTGKRKSAFQEEPILARPERRRILVLGVLTLVVFLTLGIRLGCIQTQLQAESDEKISDQSLRRIRIPARRGKIYTADMVQLAGNKANSGLVLYPEEMQIRGSRYGTIQNMFLAAEAISRAVGRPNPLETLDISRHLYYRPGLPLVLFQSLSPDELARGTEAGRAFPGVDIEPGESRTYPAGPLAAHLVGYTRIEDIKQLKEQTPEELKKFAYYIPDWIGVEGVERAFDFLPDAPAAEEGEDDPDRPLGLRGLPGYSLVRVDHLGIVRETIVARLEPRHGNNVILTLDSRAQRIAEEVLQGYCGALVLLNASNGDVIAAASAPGYDLGFFSPYIRADYYAQLRNDPNRPLYNRAFQGNYTPGSILKPLVALAFLNSGVNPAEETVCDGSTTILGITTRCASRNGHGPVNLRRALAKSCNDYMMEHSLKVKLGPIAETLRQAGIGQKTGIGPAEIAGTFPSSENKKALQRLAWNSYDTGLLSIGQGTITLSPLQAALYTAAIANGGKLFRPHLVRKVVDGLGNPLFERRPEVRNRLDAVPGALELIRAGMYDVVNTPDGSGRRAQVPGLAIFGKTGSAEVGPVNNRFKTTWFISFVTYKGQTYSCCIMLDRGDSGGTSVAPLTAEFFRRFLLNAS